MRRELKSCKSLVMGAVLGSDYLVKVRLQSGIFRKEFPKSVSKLDSIVIEYV